jgi:hypothetical protein
MQQGYLFSVLFADALKAARLKKFGKQPYADVLNLAIIMLKKVDVF